MATRGSWGPRLLWACLPLWHSRHTERPPGIGFTSSGERANVSVTMTWNLPSLVGVVALFVLCIAGDEAVAQIPVQLSPGSAHLSRQELMDVLEQYELALASPAYSSRIKAELRTAAERVRVRLATGDFRPGDRVVLSVQGQPDLPDTVPVEPGPKITLPIFGSISLDGVLRAEISEHLTRELGQMIREPVVRAQGLMRLSVQGSVGRPGFYVVPADLLISEAIMLAGGPTGDADLPAARIERASQVVYAGQELQTAMTSGRTLDQLSLQAGDQIYLPPVRASSFWPTVGRYAFIIGTTVVLGIRIAG